eukprot:scaffold7887_cov81-Skeletonema_dohrnii-CCMP3373.AAC.8
MSASAGVIKPDNLPYAYRSFTGVNRAQQYFLLLQGQKLAIDQGASDEWIQSSQLFQAYYESVSFRRTKLGIPWLIRFPSRGAAKENERRYVDGRRLPRVDLKEGPDLSGWESTTLVMMVHTEMRTCQSTTTT